MSRMLFVTLVSAALFAGCSKPTAEDYFARGQQSEQSARAVADTLNDRTKLGELFTPALGNYRDLVQEYPRHALAGEALFLTATIEQNDLAQPAEAVETYKQYVSAFPEGSKTPVAMFLVGYLYNNELQSIDSAGVWYRKFLERYPSNEMAASAQFELNNLGRSAEDLLRAQEASTQGGVPGGGKRGSRKN